MSVNSQLRVHTEYYVDSLKYYEDRFQWNIDESAMAEDVDVVVGCHYSNHYAAVRDIVQS